MKRTVLLGALLALLLSICHATSIRAGKSGKGKPVKPPACPFVAGAVSFDLTPLRSDDTGAIDPAPYKEFLTRLRNAVSDNVGGALVTKTRGFTVVSICFSEGTKVFPVKALIRNMDLYLVGFVAGNKYYYTELTDLPADVSGLDKVNLNIGVDYSTLERLVNLGGQSIAIYSMRAAVQSLSQVTADQLRQPGRRTALAKHYVTLVFTVSEAARFSSISARVSRAIRNYESFTFDDLVDLPATVNKQRPPPFSFMNLIKNWGKLSKFRANGDRQWSFDGRNFFPASALPKIVAVFKKM